MNELMRLRVPPGLLSEAKKVAAEMGTTAGALVRIFLKSLVTDRSIRVVLKSAASKDAAAEPGAGKSV